MGNEEIVKKETMFHGIPAAHGIAFGEAFVVSTEDIPISAEKIPDDQVEKEIKRFEKALEETEAELQKLRMRLEHDLGEDHAKILDSHSMILADEVARDETVKWIKEKNVNAAYAFSTVIDRVLTTFDSIEDEYLKERGEDIRDVKRRVVRNLMGQKAEDVAHLRRKAIVVAKNLTPSDTAT